MAGQAAASCVTAVGPDHPGGSAPPSRIHAACRAAPSATYSPGSGTTTRPLPRTAGATRRTASDFATADQDDPFDGDSLPRQRVDTVGQAAQQALDRGAGQVGGIGGLERQPVDGACGVGTVRRPLASSVIAITLLSRAAGILIQGGRITCTAWNITSGHSVSSSAPKAPSFTSLADYVSVPIC